MGRRPLFIGSLLILVGSLFSGKTAADERAATQTFISRPNLANAPEALFMGATVKTNPVLNRLIDELRGLSREHGVPLWRDVAERLARRQRHWSEVNLSRVSRYAKAGETVVVPGVLLGSGELTKPVTIATFRASAGARAKVEKAGGRLLRLQELAASNPKGSGVRILG